MNPKNEYLFKWDETGLITDIIEHKNKKLYQVKIFKIRGNYRVDLLEDNYDVSLENTSNDTFRKVVDTSKPVEEQVLEWASYILRRKIGVCEICKQKKIVQRLSKHDREKEEFEGLKIACKKCRSEVYDKIFEKFRLEREEEDRKFIAELDKNPPKIVGGFKKKMQAYKILQDLGNADRTDLGEGLVYVKGVLKASDNTYYPAFFTLATPGGEHWDTDFIASNLDINIPQHIVLKYLGKGVDNIFPYEYETLAHIEDDFHQKSWFGTISQRSVRHHLINQIILARPKEWDDIEDTVRVEVRSYFSIQHILSATFFLEQLREFEKSLSKDSSDQEFLNHRAFIVSIIMSCASFLEATINEVFMDAAENVDGVLNDLPKTTRNIFGRMWKKGIPRTASYTIIDKYQIALTLANKKEFDLGQLLSQDVILLIKLRNALVHFEPESVITKDIGETAKIKRQKLEQQLTGKFEINMFTGKDNPYFPDKCLSIGCANWAIDATLDFTDEFFMKLGIFPTYQGVKYLIDQVR
ncbi:hypothetical protein [Flavisolibacter ginsengisoli]|jgi:hypothetical protein|nr:hypothetical protein [Flavisolibacter ginsengisoli]